MLGPKAQLKYWLYNRVPGFAGRYPYLGTQVHFRPGALVIRALCQTGAFEPDIVRRMVRFARPATTVFDVGANIGLMAIPVLQAHPTCRVVSFEPSPSSLPFLRQTVAGSAYGDRWTVAGRGLAHVSGEMDLAASASRDGLFDGLLGAGEAREDAVRVPVSTLDEEWRALGSPDVSLVKIDVEGAEGLVLAGARALLSAQRPALLVEWHEPYLRRLGTPPDALLACARECGYRIFSIPGGVPVDDERTLSVQMIDCQNFLLLREGAA